LRSHGSVAVLALHLPQLEARTVRGVPSAMIPSYVPLLNVPSRQASHSSFAPTLKKLLEHGSVPFLNSFTSYPAPTTLQYGELSRENSPGPLHGLQESVPPTLYVDAKQSSHELVVDDAFVPAPQYSHAVELLVVDT